MHIAAEIAKWAIVALYVIGFLATVSKVGQPRKPTTPKDVIANFVANAVIVTAIIILWKN